MSQGANPVQSWYVLYVLFPAHSLGHMQTHGSIASIRPSFEEGEAWESGAEDDDW